MPPRNAPTARQIRLGAELRKLRERAGLTAAEAAARLGTERPKISNIETGRFGVSADRVRALARAYHCADEALIDALVGMTGERRRHHWWEEYRGVVPNGFLDLAEFEHNAVKLRTVQTATLPGLLQTVDHARALFQQTAPPLPPHEVEHRISHRIKRQVVLFREDPTEYTAIIHEAALRMQFGGRAVTRAQLDHILAMGERDHVTIHALPFEAGAFPAPGQTIGYSIGPVPQLDTVQLDHIHGPVFLDAPAQLETYRSVLDRMEALALKPEESRDFIREIARSL
ncbi:helix-turn-helix transcriptional regulator [Streptomyces sp. XD-27]|uniref:helix-turn-helix domain-containing protein n=1 Tax=Streptomyces sp. XD-27 TaxID=3062779 RepID=UPI0026F433C0|nr:helix-turn-helix transcriptional regulator [Streptomyces sp. XD-27]WKX71362.1 helix-turn-helix transcriptional regulator [Streptomyces sp. XD-27]